MARQPSRDAVKIVGRVRRFPYSRPRVQRQEGVPIAVVWRHTSIPHKASTMYPFEPYNNRGVLPDFLIGVSPGILHTSSVHPIGSL